MGCGQNTMNHLPRKAPMASRKLHDLRDYWMSRRNGKAMPSRGDIDPTAIPRLLPNITLTDVLYNPLRFRYRLVGTGIVAMAGRDATGQWLDQELYGDKLQEMLWGFTRCVERKMPMALRESVLFVDKKWVVVEVLFLPLAEQDGAINMLLSGVTILAEDVEIPPPDCSYVLDWQSPSQTAAVETDDDSFELLEHSEPVRQVYRIG